MAGFGPDVNDFFDGLILIIEITILLVQLSLYWQMKAVSEVTDKYVLVGSGDEVEFYQIRLLILQVCCPIH